MKKPKPEVLKVLDDWARKDSREWANWEEFELDSEEAPLIKDMAKYAYEQGKLDLVELLEKEVKGREYFDDVEGDAAHSAHWELVLWLKSQIKTEKIISRKENEEMIHERIAGAQFNPLKEKGANSK